MFRLVRTAIAIGVTSMCACGGGALTAAPQREPTTAAASPAEEASSSELSGGDAVAPDDGWVEFRAEGGGFSVRLPALPEDMSLDERHRLFEITGGHGEASFQVGWTLLDAPPTDTFIRSFQHGYAAGHAGSIESTSEIEVVDVTGADLVINGAAYVCHTRMLFTAAGVIYVSVLSPPGVDTAEARERSFSSLEVE